MIQMRTDRDPLPALVEDPRLALVQRIINSSHFQKARQLREILLYLVSRALEETPTPISEYDVACNALGRRPDFNSNEDNIVRVQIRQLRKKLENYFESEGRAESILLTVPKGSYAPHFETREPAVSNAEPTLAPVAELDPIVSLPEPAVRPKLALPPRETFLLAGMFLLIAVAAVILWHSREQSPKSAATSVQPPGRTAETLWSKIFAPSAQTSIVVTDSCLVMLQDILDIDIPLADYLSGAYPARTLALVQDPKLQSSLRLIAARQYTSLGDMTVAAKLVELAHAYKSTPRISYARHLGMREFKSGNYILVGSRRGIPWIQLFESQLNFGLEQDPKTRKFHIRNKSPLRGEKAVYGADNYEESYADIALLPNLSGTGFILMLSGVTMEMTEAAGELVASPEFPALLNKIVNAPVGEAGIPFLEILMQAKSMAGTARAPKIVAHRLIAPQKSEP